MKRGDLDPSQLRFCNDLGTALRLLAPAGSGKTQSLLWRCAQRAEAGGQQQERFLIVTFTRAARDELRQRIGQDSALVALAPAVEVTTLNSWGYRWLRKGTQSPKLLTSAADRYLCINNVLQSLWQSRPLLKKALSDSNRKAQYARTVFELIDDLKSLGFRHDACEKAEFMAHVEWLSRVGMKPHMTAILKRLAQIGLLDQQAPFENQLNQCLVEFIPFWRDACERLRDASMFSLEDQKYWALSSLNMAIAAGRHARGIGRFSEVLVDE